MINRYSIEELADEVNKRLKETNVDTSITDGRVSNLVTTRKIRDLMTKELIGKPFKDGRNNYFDDSHVEQIIHVKELQKEGASEKLIKGLGTSRYEYLESNSVEPESNLQTNALNALAAIQNRSLGTMASSPLTRGITPSGSLGSTTLLESAAALNGKPEMNPVLQKSMTYMESQRSNVKVYSEIPLDNTGKVYLKLEQNYTPTNKDEILEKIKQLLGMGD